MQLWIEWPPTQQCCYQAVASPSPSFIPRGRATTCSRTPSGWNVFEGDGGGWDFSLAQFVTHGKRVQIVGGDMRFTFSSHFFYHLRISFYSHLPSNAPFPPHFFENSAGKRGPHYFSDHDFHQPNCMSYCIVLVFLCLNIFFLIFFLLEKFCCIFLPLK